VILSKETKTQYKLLKQFVIYRMLVLEKTRKEDVQHDVETLDFISNLMSMPISQKSLFHHNQWDYNGEAGMAANVRGSVLRIDFDKYLNIPEFIKIEVKCLTHLYFLTPASFKSRGRKKKTIKANTLVGLTHQGLRYIDRVFEQMSEEYGEEYIHSELFSLTEINRLLFEKTASEYDFVFSTDLKIFLDNLSHPYASKAIFERKVECDDAESLDWKLLKGYTGRQPQRVIKDEVFEKLVVNASFYIVDFLSSLGIKPKDKNTLNHLKSMPHNVKLCSDLGVNEDVFSAYALVRLRDAGYENDYIKSKLGDSVFNQFTLKKRSKCEVLEGATIRFRLSENIGVPINELEELFKMVYYASLYIFAQFTGMRPSELSEVALDCLDEENGFHLVRGKVIKGNESLLKGLFDEKWLAIPIVRDAVESISVLNKLYHNAFLFGATNVTKPGEKREMVSSGTIANQTIILLGAIFGEKRPSGVIFNSYMTRHTLAYQMFRADIGLPFISFQLKHFVDDVSRYTSVGQHSSVTLCYGGIGEALEQGTRGLRKKAELEGIKSIMNPDGTYLGEKGKEHKERVQKLFEGYMAEGYTSDEIYEALVEQGVALINVGQGFCYGGRFEDFDDSIPCIGSLRCNPLRCKNAIVTKANAPKWREVYSINKINSEKPEYSESREQMIEAMNEAKAVLEYLSEEVTL